MPCWVAGHWTRRTSRGSQKSSGDTCRLGAGGRRVLGARAVAGGRSGPSWLMAPTGCVVRGTRRSGVVAAGEAVLVRGVGRAVVVVLRGGEVAGPGREEGIQNRVTPCPGPCHGMLRHASTFPEEGGYPGHHWVWEISPGLSLSPRPSKAPESSKNSLECGLRSESNQREPAGNGMCEHSLLPFSFCSHYGRYNLAGSVPVWALVPHYANKGGLAQALQCPGAAQRGPAG